MRIRIVRGDKVQMLSLRKGATAGDVFKKLALHPDAYIAMMSNRPVPLTKEIKDGEEVRIVKVASGG